MNKDRFPVFLICTVDGSPQPIATALRRLRTDVVWFLVSDGKAGESSRTQVESPEIDCDQPTAVFADGCQQQPGSWRFLDDPDGACKICRSQLAEARKRYLDHRLIRRTNTVGTKSMTGALLMAALRSPVSMLG